MTDGARLVALAQHSAFTPATVAVLAFDDGTFEVTQFSTQPRVRWERTGEGVTLAAAIKDCQAATWTSVPVSAEEYTSPRWRRRMGRRKR